MASLVPILFASMAHGLWKPAKSGFPGYTFATENLWKPAKTNVPSFTFTSDNLVKDPKTNNNVTLQFIHIPKCAGSSVEDMGAEYGFSWGRHNLQDTVLRAEHPKCMGAQYYHGVPVGKKSESTKTFCIVRDPYERTISQIKWELTCGGRHAPCPSADLLNELIQTQLDRNMVERQWPCHWVQQYLYVKNCDHVLRHAHLDEDIAKLAQHYGVDFRMGETHEMNDGTNLGNGECKLNTSMLSKETMVRLEKEYHLDAELLTWLNDDVIQNNEKLGLRNRLEALDDEQVRGFEVSGVWKWHGL
uniref:Sulfotransferase domain-containing protein n=1 Tax=Lotharella globosa TaxID=91324 RepID=A0A7S3Z7U4_9EUKA|mmetsp:Transcript_7582/g.14090  ORF Transcript_7582/g.14090 Transcript_7582/m.14090 type:complete len:302 (+) Transcript_7582:1-906(+)